MLDNLYGVLDNLTKGLKINAIKEQKSEKSYNSAELANNIKEYFSIEELISALKEVSYEDLTDVEKSRFSQKDLEEMKVYSSFMRYVYNTTNWDDDRFLAMFYIHSNFKKELGQELCVKLDSILYASFNRADIKLF